MNSCSHSLKMRMSNVGREGAGLWPASRPRLTGLGDTRYNQNKKRQGATTHNESKADHTHSIVETYRFVQTYSLLHLYCTPTAQLQQHKQITRASLRKPYRFSGACSLLLFCICSAHVVKVGNPTGFLMLSECSQSSLKTERI